MANDPATRLKTSTDYNWKSMEATAHNNSASTKQPDNEYIW